VNLYEEKVREELANGTILLQASGSLIGQVNCLSTEDLSKAKIFGYPCKVTASAGLGKSGVINIERESNLGSNIHHKGVLIIGGYIR
jgi:predicted ATP-dependent protease